MRRKTLCLDFDGVVNSYKSGWTTADDFPDVPVDGAIEFIRKAQKYFVVVIHSSRFNGSHPGLCVPIVFDKMEQWFRTHGFDGMIENYERWIEKTASENPLILCSVKPPAFMTLDDRGATFTGVFPDPESLLAFVPWNKR